MLQLRQLKREHAVLWVSIKQLWSVCFFFSPPWVARLHFSCATSDDCNPCKQSERPWWLCSLLAKTNWEDFVSGFNFCFALWGVGLREDGVRGELVMLVPPLAHAVTGWLLALSPPAPASALDERHCHFSHLLVLIKLLQAADRIWQAFSSYCSAHLKTCPTLSWWLMNKLLMLKGHLPLTFRT